MTESDIRGLASCSEDSGVSIMVWCVWVGGCELGQGCGLECKTGAHHKISPYAHNETVDIHRFVHVFGCEGATA